MACSTTRSRSCRSRSRRTRSRARCATSSMKEATVSDRERLQVLARTTQLFLHATDDVDRLLRVVAAEVAATVADSCSLWLLDEERTTLQAMAFESRDPAIAAEWRDIFQAQPVDV